MADRSNIGHVDKYNPPGVIIHWQDTLKATLLPDIDFHSKYIEHHRSVLCRTPKICRQWSNSASALCATT